MATAVVTGAASGFGAALADRGAALGMDVALLDREGERAEAEATRIAATHGVRTLALATDVGDPASVEAAAAAVGERFGAVDLLLSNVGVQLFGGIEAFTDDEWRWMLDVNVVGSARVTRAFLPLLRRSSDPRVAFTASTSILDPGSRLAAYQASKFAVWGLAEALRVELAPDGIGVAVVLPSGMITRHLETSVSALPGELRRPVASDEDLEVMIASNPRMATMITTPEDAADGVIEAILAGDPYVITHGDVTGVVADRAAALEQAARRARERT